MDEIPKNVPIKDRYTYADYQAMPSDGNRYEVVDGELEVSPSPTTAHQWASKRVCLLLEEWAEEHAEGLVFYAPLTVYLSDDNVVEPDLMWISKPRIREIVTRKIIRGAPDLIVEVASPSTRRWDRVKKLRVYARFGVREYWLVDPEDETVEILVLESGQYRIHAAGSGSEKLASAIDPRLVVEPASLFLQL